MEFELYFRLVWFDSMGAKSSCVYISTRGIKLIIDPGVAIMHPSFPGSWAEKIRWLEEGTREVLKYLNRADVVIISHYHYDHFIPDNPEVYVGKTLFVKNPNVFINDSQYERAYRFFSGLFEVVVGEDLQGRLVEHDEIKPEDPLKGIPVARSLDLGDYNDRRRELLDKGLKWFKNRVKAWNSRKFIPEIDSKNIRVFFAEGKTFSFGRIKLSFSKPVFHGIEFSRVGWVFITEISDGRFKIIHSSDVNGPIIEDYAEYIIRRDPDVLILDGPMTYMLGYTLNLINFKRIVKNLKRIISETKSNPIILDHHLPREKRFKERLSEVYRLAETEGKEVLTAAEYYGEEPVVLKY